jgi:hypothetical protein
MIPKTHSNCRVCQSDDLIPYLDLGYLPLSNNVALTPENALNSERYPLKVLLCQQCGLSQLSIVIPPEEMFSHYVYRSGISKGYRDHCSDMALSLKQKHNLNEDSFHIDIAGNDSTLLQEFIKQGVGKKNRSLNVDPAANLVCLNKENEVRVYTAFWGMKAAMHLENTQWPKADLITGTNVLAHVDNITNFIRAAQYAMKPTGVLVLEFPYLVDFIEKKEFDTIYHEHSSYFSIYPLTLLSQQCGLEVLSVEKQNIHGGSVRVTIGNGQPDETVKEFVMNERARFNKIDPYYHFAEEVHFTILEFREFMRSHSNVAGFAASAKGNTLLNCTGTTDEHMRYIVDETPEKVGMYSPGTGIPIVDLQELRSNPPDYLVILSWNFEKEIIDKVRAIGYKGKFVTPIPKLTIHD